MSSRVHTTSEEFDNKALFLLRFGLLSTSIRHENGDFLKRSSNWKTLALRLSRDRKHFEHEAFRKRRDFANQSARAWLKPKSKTTSYCCIFKFLRPSMDGKTLDAFSGVEWTRPKIWNKKVQIFLQWTVVLISGQPLWFLCHTFSLLNSLKTFKKLSLTSHLMCLYALPLWLQLVFYKVWTRDQVRSKQFGVSGDTRDQPLLLCHLCKMKQTEDSQSVSIFVIRNHPRSILVYSYFLVVFILI